MSTAKKLLGQTAIYGLSSILGRFSYFLLTPLHTKYLTEELYGANAYIYASIGILTVVLTFGLETAFFRHASKSDADPNRLFGNAHGFIVATTFLFAALILLFRSAILDTMGYTEQPQYLYMALGILCGELLVAVPFARLRLQMRPLRFAVIRLSGIAINILVNLYFFMLAPFFYSKGISTFGFEGTHNVEMIFIANLCSSLWLVLAFIPVHIKIRIHLETIKPLLIYGFPLMLAGLAGITNELIDRIIIRHILGDFDNGVYAAVIKLAMFMTLAIQAYRYAIEPYIFSTSENKNAQAQYARIFDFLVVFLVIAMTGITAGLDVIKNFIDDKYHHELSILPFLLISQLLLGLIMHVSLWYKLADKTRYGMYLSFIAAAITITANLALLPLIGILGAAWANLLSHLVVLILSIYWGQKRYFVPYRFFPNALVVMLAVFVTFAFYHWQAHMIWKLLIWVALSSILAYRERETLKGLLPHAK
jgi:O-antigen/teichoic acid export membrane protein